MAVIKPFAALRPRPELAARICELPYDVLSSDEARALARDNPLSFLHVSKPEIDLPAGTDPYSPAVYAQGRENLNQLIAQGALYREPQPRFYLYRQVMDGHRQTGLVAVARCADYLDQVIKRHELTRPDKEDDRLRHIETLGAQTGPVFLVHRAVPALEELLRRESAAVPEVDFVACDGVRHSAWTVRDPAVAAAIEAEFSRIPSLYIADGHHRCAAAARVCQARRGAGASAYFLAVIFPHREMQILPYHRALRDLGGRDLPGLLRALEACCHVAPAGAAVPTRKHQFGLYAAGSWRTLEFRASCLAGGGALPLLDVALLQEHVLTPLFGIHDPRTSERVSFVGGIRGTAELERLVNGGEFACAFSLFPTSIEDLMAIADAGGILPPKSTWFEPKLRDAMFCHLL